MNLKNQATRATQIARLKQQLRRQELTLARLKIQRLREQQNQNRLKLRMGSLLTFVDEKDLPDEPIKQLSKRLTSLLQSEEELEKYKLIGSELLSADKQNNEKITANNERKTAKRLHIDILIEKGDSFVQQRLQNYDRATVLGLLATLKQTEL